LIKLFENFKSLPQKITYDRWSNELRKPFPFKSGDLKQIVNWISEHGFIYCVNRDNNENRLASFEGKNWSDKMKNFEELYNWVRYDWFKKINSILIYDPESKSAGYDVYITSISDEYFLIYVDNTHTDCYGCYVADQISELSSLLSLYKISLDRISKLLFRPK
jgi:hypothetical protein